jgi:hypothetical protein
VSLAYFPSFSIFFIPNPDKPEPNRFELTLC